MLSAAARVHQMFLNLLIKFDRRMEFLNIINCPQILCKQPGQVVKERL